jgi:hypothetical protein
VGGWDEWKAGGDVYQAKGTSVRGGRGLTSLRNEVDILYTRMVCLLYVILHAGQHVGDE